MPTASTLGRQRPSGVEISTKLKAPLEGNLCPPLPVAEEGGHEFGQTLAFAQAKRHAKA